MKKVNEIIDEIINSFTSIFSKHAKEISNSKQVIIKIIVIVVPVVIIIIIINLIISGVRNSNCYNIRKELSNYVDSYVMSYNLWPTINGDSVVINLDNVKKVTFKDQVCSGEVKITKVNDEFIKTFYLENCNYCSASESDFKNEKSKYNSKLNADVIVYINYYNVTNNNSPWSEYIPYEEISTEETNGVMLPLNEEDLPEISDEAIITEIVKEDKTFYSYRNKLWLWYKVNNNDYSDFSSEQPSGYANKDKRTEIKSDYSEWSIDYPEEKSYRVISNRNGYRWYKKDEDGKIVWWNNGEYYPDMPEDGYKRDDDNKITMYRYFDYLWKWYNGEARGYYSSYSATPPSKSYIYKDEDLTRYTDWSGFVTYSSVNSDNEYYREEITNVHSRYMIKYKIRSFLVLDEFLERTEFEETLGRTLEEMSEDINVDLEITFKYRYQ